MKRRELELKRLEWRDKSDPQRILYATLTWHPTDRVNGYPARYTAFLANIRRDPRYGSGVGFWEIGNPFETVSRTLVTLPKGARRSRITDSQAWARFDIFLHELWEDYVERYGLRVNYRPDLCAP